MQDLIHFFFLSVHFISGILWWGITFFIVFIVRPKNKNGALSFILPTVQKYVLVISTITITSGIFLMLVNTNFEWNKLLYSLWGRVVLIGGIFSIPSYLRVLFTYRKPNIIPTQYKRTNKKDVFYIPYVLFGLLTITILMMLYLSQLI